MDSLERAALLWSYADSILRSCAVVEAKHDLDLLFLYRVNDALNEYFKTTGDEEAFGKVLQEITELLRAAVEASNR